MFRFNSISELQTLLLLAFLLQPVPAWTRSFSGTETPTPWVGQIGLRFADLRDQPDCRASFLLESGRICIPESLWKEHLARGTALSGVWKGKWKTHSPPVNDPENLPKRILREFRVTCLPDSVGFDPKPGFLHGVLLRIERERARFSESFRRSDRLGVFRSLILNERTDETPAGMLRILGIVHLLSATGIHLYAVSALWNRILLRFSVLLLISPRWAIPFTRGVVGLSWIWAWVLTGARPGMLRPVLLVSGRSAATALGFRWRRWSPLALAISIDLAAGHGGFTGGRMIYALAVGGGLLAQETHSRWRHFRLAVGSWCFVAILDSWKNSLVAFGTPLLSLLTLPVFCAAIYPAWLISSILQKLGIQLEIPESCISGLNHLILLVLRSALALPNLWMIPRESLLIGAGLGLLCLISRSNLVRFVTFGTAVGLGLFVREAGTNSRPPAVLQLDVGQGDAALVLQHGQAGMIDSGSERALGEEKWLSLFARQGVSEINWIGLTHLDQDHAGGVARLGRIIRVGCVATSSAELKSERGKKFAARLIPLGIHVESWAGGCAQARVLPPAHEGREKKNGNMSALLISLPPSGFYLSAGDADAADELRIADWAAHEASGSSRRILKISHHGSRFSTSEAWLERLKPTEAWISSGIGNRYGHPSAQTLTLLEKAGIPVLRTDQLGMISSELIKAGDDRRRPRKHPP